MADVLFSPSWYRVAELKPRLRAHTQLHRHEYRGQVWYILQDHAGGRSHRITPAAYRFIGLMDGERTVQQLWDLVNTQAGDEAPTQDEAIRLLGQLHAADALLCDVPPDTQELLRRFQRHRRQRWKQQFWSPLAIRINLFDPDRFLDATFPYLRFLFTPWGGLLWLGVVLTGAILAGVHWQELTADIGDRILTPANLVLLWFIYPLVKAAHELMHGYATKYGGGEVHELGIMFLVLIPIPYVDVSSAWGFRDKYQRMLVGAAGITTELFLGALAMLVWVTVERGLVHAIAYNVLMISGISTLLFNGNPLLRFDGYYVLADALEIPNLGNRANRYLGYLVQRYLFAVKDAESPADSRGERVWFILYGLASFIYRTFIMFAIILYIGGRFFTVGVLLAIWALFTQAVVPMAKSLSFLFTSPRLRTQRRRSIGVTALALGLILTLLFVVPVPFWTRAEGVTWPAERSQIRATVDGFIEAIVATPGATVTPGQELIRLNDTLLLARIAVLKAKKQEFESQLVALEATDRVRTGIIREEIEAVAANLQRALEQQAQLVIRSPSGGRFILPDAPDLQDRFIHRGQLLGYVVDATDLATVRAVVSQDEIALVKGQTQAVAVIPTGWSEKSYPGVMERQVAGGNTQLPTPVLGMAGGGRFAVDPRDANGRTTLDRVFQVEVKLLEALPTELLGRRMYVRFDHGFEPLGWQWYRSFRQLFLRRFSV